MDARLRGKVDTPTLLIDMDQVRRNAEWMAAVAAKAGIALRPHIKTHKSLTIASIQKAAGMAGITCAKLGEAEVMAEAGFNDIFIAYDIVGAPKVDRLLALARKAQVCIGATSIYGIQEISKQAEGSGVSIGVLVEIDTGLHRGGMPATQVPELARAITKMAGLRFEGLFAYGGYHAGAGEQEKIRAAALEVKTLTETRRSLKVIGIECRRLSGGATPLAAYYGNFPGLTEMRPGTYIFGDVATVSRGAMPEEWVAATVAASVIARPATDLAVIDAGTKALENQRWAGAKEDDGWARIKGDWHSRVVQTWEEHGLLKLSPHQSGLRVGDVVELVPNHICPVVNLYDRACAVHEGRIQGVVPIEARGRSQ